MNDRIYYYLAGWKEYASAGDISVSETAASFNYLPLGNFGFSAAKGTRIPYATAASLGAAQPLANAWYFKKSGGAGPSLFAVVNAQTSTPEVTGMTLEQMKAEMAAKSLNAAQVNAAAGTANYSVFGAPAAQAGMGKIGIVLGALAVALLFLKKRGK